MPTDRESLVRARFCQEWLENAAAEAEPHGARFVARVDAALREKIESAARVGWLPLSIYVQLADITQDAFGAVQAHAYYRRAFAASLTTPFFAPMMQLGARLLGLTPATFIRWASKGWDASFKNAGTVTGELLGPGHGQLLYRDLPAIFTDSDAWLLSCQGSAYGAYDVLGVDGVVRLDIGDRNVGRVVLDLEWTERGG
jgi:hypothetical protein